MKYCITCKCLKPKTDFNKKNTAKDGLQTKCRACFNVLKDSDRRRVSKWFFAYKQTLSCDDCGFNHPAVLDFHHIDPATKHDEVSRMLRGRKSIDSIKAEIAKCKVLCSNCHRILHWNERNVTDVL